MLYGFAGEPTLDTVVDLEIGDGYFAFAPPFQAGVAACLTNSIGRTKLLGTGRFPAADAPATVLDLPGGLSQPMTLGIQGLVRDAGSDGSDGYSATNALVLIVR